MSPDTPAPGDRPSPETARALLDQAREARQHAYAPYSGFPVGAALLAGSGAVFTGCNVENAAYPLSLCAERVALGSAIAGSAGSAPATRTFTAIAVVGPDDTAPCWPCGSCRQVLHELAPELWVISPSGRGEFGVARLSELLPHPFGPRTLDRGR